MKREEKIAEKYFKSVGHKNIIFEPKGNRTPDFEIDSKIAIEVRRLNQFYNGEPIEKKQYNLLPRIIKHIESFGNGNHEKSAFFSIKYSRPITFNKKIKEKISLILESHCSSIELTKNYKISDNLEIDFIPSTEIFDNQYQFGLSIDYNQGGLVLGNIYESLKVIIPEKIEKTEKYKSDYGTWWLALVDFIGNGLSESEIQNLRNSIDFDLYFDKIFIISYSEPIRGREL